MKAGKTLTLTELDPMRRWIYRARLSSTGRVLSITAGCRKWRSFDEALDHYTGGGKYNQVRWNLNTTLQGISNAIATGQPVLKWLNTYAARQSAISTLMLLEERVVAVKERLRQKKKRSH